MNKIFSLLITISVGMFAFAPGELPFIPAETSQTEPIPTTETAVVTTETTVPVVVPTETLMTSEVTVGTSTTSEATISPTEESSSNSSVSTTESTSVITIATNNSTNVVNQSVESRPEGGGTTMMTSYSEVVSTSIETVALDTIPDDDINQTTYSNTTVNSQESESSVIVVSTSETVYVAEFVSEDVSNTSNLEIETTVVANNPIAESNEDFGQAVIILVVIAAVIIGLLGFISWKKRKE